MKNEKSRPTSFPHWLGFYHQNKISSGEFELSASLSAKLEQLAQWRIEPSSIKVAKGATKFDGRHATVLRAKMKLKGGVFLRRLLKRRGAENAVAVKKMKISNDIAQVLGSTLREAGFLAELSHPNIMKLYGFVEDISQNRVWLVFPWEDNGNLSTFVALADWEVPERVSLIFDVARGVEYLHSRKPPIRHGDLKSMNILVSPENHAIITDFGSARRLTAQNLEKARERIKNPPQAESQFKATFCESTQTITVTGDRYTLRWAAPELLKETEPWLWSDIWALGWVAYEVMTNSIPFCNVHDSKVILNVTRGDLPSISNDARLSLIRILGTLMIQCWSIDPEKRPTAEEYRKAIDWMPKVIPSSKRIGEAPDLVGYSSEELMEFGDMYRRQSDYPNALKYTTKALSVCTQSGDSRGKGVALMLLAEIHLRRNEFSQAIRRYSESLEIWNTTGDIECGAYNLFGIAEVHRFREEYTEAIKFYSACLQIWTDDMEGKALVFHGLGEVHRFRDEYDHAVKFYSQAVQLLTEMGDQQRRTSPLLGLAEVHRHRKEYNQALNCYSEVLKTHVDWGDRSGEAHTLWGIAETHRYRGDPQSAIHHYKQVAEIFNQIGHTDGEATVQKRMASIME